VQNLKNKATFNSKVKGMLGMDATVLLGNLGVKK
jgi:hypothetical protein